MSDFREYSGFRTDRKPVSPNRQILLYQIFDDFLYLHSTYLISKPKIEQNKMIIGLIYQLVLLFRVQFKPVFAIGLMTHHMSASADTTLVHTT